MAYNVLSLLITISAIFNPQVKALVTSVTLNSTYTHPELWFAASTGLIPSLSPLPGRQTNLSVESFNYARGSFTSVRQLMYTPAVQRDCLTQNTILYRTADGSCNHPLHLGQSQQPLSRLVAPAYADGLQSPRKFSVTGSPLPGPREVSRAVHIDTPSVTNFTLFLMQWGQFMDHEIVSTPLPIEESGSRIRCCGINNTAPNGTSSSECLPILFASGDPDFQGTCMEFVRSKPVTDSLGKVLLPREQENAVTSFIDGSTIYGSTEERLQLLRDPFNRHLLRTSSGNFLPDSGNNDCVKRINSSDVCFLAGDERVNEQPGLTLLHTLFMRYHNALALELMALRPRASPDRVFQQARAVVGAVMQNIMYSEWLPLVLGHSVRARYKLDLHPSFRTRYDQTIDPRVFNTFSTAAFRFGHSLLPRSLPLSPTRRALLREIFFRPFEAKDNLQHLLDGFVQARHSEDRSQQSDQFFVKEVTAHLYEKQPGDRQGFDLVALTLQRSRDHGLPSYATLRAHLGLRRIMHFTDPALGTAGSFLASVYRDVDDIDLFSGGVSEPPFDGGLVGETLSSLIATQFQRLKFGDRFFFDNTRPFGFNKMQLSQIKRVRLAHVLCVTSHLPTVQRDIFRVASARNPRVDCSTLRANHPRMKLFTRYPL